MRMLMRDLFANRSLISIRRRRVTVFITHLAYFDFCFTQCTGGHKKLGDHWVPPSLGLWHCWPLETCFYTKFGRCWSYHLGVGPKICESCGPAPWMRHVLLLETRCYPTCVTHQISSFYLKSFGRRLAIGRFESHPGLLRTEATSVAPGSAINEYQLSTFRHAEARRLGLWRGWPTRIALYILAYMC